MSGLFLLFIFKITSTFKIFFIHSFNRDDVKWDEEQETEAQKKVNENSEIKFDPTTIEKYEIEADKYWDDFYGIHSNRFFKDRHWLFTEFPELIPKEGGEEKKVIFEIGCGVGNTIIPILQYAKDSNLFIYGCDFSSKAIDIFREHPDYDPQLCEGFVLDATSDDWMVPFEEESIDIVVLIFVLSAIHPSK